MAIQPDGQLQTLAEDIFAVLYPTFPVSPSQAQVDGKTASIASMKKIVIKIMDYLVTQLEVKGITMNLDSDALTGNGGGTDTLGGVHVPGVASPTNLAVTGTVTNKAGTQSNDGKNRVL